MVNLSGVLENVQINFSASRGDHAETLSLTQRIAEILSPETVFQFWKRVIPNEDEDECWGWSGYTARGYGSFEADGKKWAAHQVAWDLFNGKSHRPFWVLHRCDNPICCNPKHLFLGTNRDNVIDSIRKGNHGCKGNRIPNALVDQIREDFRIGVLMQIQIAEKYGVSSSQVCKIVNRKTVR